MRKNTDVRLIVFMIWVTSMLFIGATITTSKYEQTKTYKELK